MSEGHNQGSANGLDEVRKALDGALEIQPSAPQEPPTPSDPRFTPDEYKEIKRLHTLHPFELDRQIKKAADNLDCNVSTLRQVLKELDHAERTSGDGANSGRGRKRTIVDVKSWPDTVNLASLLDEIAEEVRLYLVTAPGVPETVALWTMHTHAIDAAFISPRLVITSPEKRCGKTTLLILLSAFVARPLPTANITAAALFRTIQRARPTALVDEADTFFKEAEDLRGITNRRTLPQHLESAPVVDVPEGGQDVREFDVWCAMAIAAIGKLPGTTEDRSIKLPMRRRRPDEKIERLRLDRLDEFEHLAQKCRRWALDSLARLRRLDPLVPEALHDRAADNWRTLLAIADAAGGEWPKRARDAALALASIEDSESTRELLLRDLRALFDPMPADPKADPPVIARAARDVLFTAEILDALGQMVERPWPEFGRARKPITAHQVAALLHPLGVLSNMVHRGKRESEGYQHGKGHRRADLEDAFARYLKER